MPNDSAQSCDVNWEAISAIGQLVGALAVVISLIYLARQVRSNARATRQAAMRSTLDTFNRWAQQLTEHPDLAELCYRGFDDFESLEGADRARFGSFMHQMFRTVEDMYYQHLEGHLDPRLWRGLEVLVRDINAHPGVQAWWRSRSHWFDGRSLRSSLISNSKQPPGMMTSSQHVYEVRPRKDHRGVDLISDALPFGRLWYDEPNAASNAIGYASSTAAHMML